MGDEVKDEEIAEDNEAVEEEIAENNGAFDVTINPDDGVTAPYTVSTDGNVAEPAKPTKNGYTFGGWMVNNTVVTFPYSVTSNVTLTAKWTGLPITVEYHYTNAQSQDAKLPTDGSAVFGSKIANKPAGPTVSGKSFVYWAKDSNGANRWYFEGEALPAGQNDNQYKVTSDTLSVTWQDATGASSNDWTKITKGKVSLHAKMANVYTVDFVDAATDKALDSTTAYEGMKYTPAAPTK